MARVPTPGVSKASVQNSTYTYAPDAQASDAYAITLTPAPAAYAAGQTFAFKANTANTGAASLNVNSLGAKTIKKLTDQDLATGDIEAGTIVIVTYDGTNFQMQSQLADVTGSVVAASETVAGKVELATLAETNTGTDNTRAVHPDGLAGSYAGTKSVEMICFDFGTDVATGDGKGYFRVPSSLNGMNLVAVAARVITAGTTNTTDIQIHNVTDAVDMLSTKITIDSTETDSSTAATPPVIDGAADDVATGDLLRIDVDAVSTTAPKGLLVVLEFRLP